MATAWAEWISKQQRTRSAPQRAERPHLRLLGRRQPAERAGDRRDALDHSRARYRDFALLEGNDGQGSEGFEQFTGAQQKIRIAGAAEPLITDSKGLVDQHAIRRERSGECREQWPMQVIGYHDPVIAAAERPASA